MTNTYLTVTEIQADQL